MGAKTVHKQYEQLHLVFWVFQCFSFPRTLARHVAIQTDTLYFLLQNMPAERPEF